MHATRMRTINHENNVVMLLLVHYQRLEVLQKPTESEDVSKYTSIWKICTDGKFSVKISGLTTLSVGVWEKKRVLKPWPEQMSQFQVESTTLQCINSFIVFPAFFHETVY